jgi:NADH:ubiquinone reductase (H+-translocating)
MIHSTGFSLPVSETCGIKGARHYRMDAISTNRRKRVVILGGGFGGAYCARGLEKVRDVPPEVFLIDTHNYFIFYPLLIEAGTGRIEPRHAVVPLRPYLKRTHVVTGEIQSIDTAAQNVFYRTAISSSPVAIEYDHLVIALGSRTRMIDLPGLREHAFQLKTLADAIALRDRAIQMLEFADASRSAAERTALLQFVIVGGNFTGTELAGHLQELLNEASRYYDNVHSTECRVILIELAERILPALDEELSSYAAVHLSRMGVDIRLRTSVQNVTGSFVDLSTGERLATNTVIWCAGVAPNPLIAKLPLPVDTKGYIRCDRDMRVSGFQNIWAVGDCAVILDAQGRPYPATAQHAIQEARCLAMNLSRVFTNREPLACDIKTRGSLAAIGQQRGVARIGRVRLSGFAAWLVNRLYYLWQMPGWARKMRIGFDWLLDLIFSPDYVQVGVHKATAVEEDREAA